MNVHYCLFLATGISILNIHFLSEIPYLDWFFTILFPILFLFGMNRYFLVKKHIKQIISDYSESFPK